MTKNKIMMLDDKKVKTAFLKSLERNNNIVKNIFDEVYINNEGICYNINSELSKYQGRCICNTSFHRVFGIEKDELFLLKPSRVRDLLKAGKTGITHCEVKDNIFIIYNKDIPYEIGAYEQGKEINIDYLRNIEKNKSETVDVTDNLINFNNKEFVEIKLPSGKEMLMTHRLVPLYNKAHKLTVSISDVDKDSFYGIYEIYIEELNKKEEIVFSSKITTYFRYLKL